MEGTNFQTFHQMKGFVNDQAKQSMGIDSVQTLDMKWVTVGQNKRLVQGAVEESARATFSVNSPGSLKSLKVFMKPVQDLHGYSNPWPAGGGKNLLKPEFYLTGSNMYFGGNSIDTRVTTLNPGTYTFSVVPSDDLPVAVYIMDSENTQTYASNTNGKSVTHTFAEETEVVLKVYSTRFSDGMTIDKFQLELGSTATAWSPYTNICPITGHSSVNVYHSGEDTTDYETVTVTFPEDPGTVYGGTLDLVTGELTVTWASVDMGTLTWIKGADKFYTESAVSPAYKQPAGTAVSDANIMCTKYPYAGGAGTITPITDKRIYYDWNRIGCFIVRDDSYTDSVTFKASMSGVQLVYELATPETYQLTAQDIETLAGENNIWSNAGNVTVEYYDLEEVP